ncbi:hypothetical protein DXA13_00055 [Clostridium sp. AM58-1XD]|nr:hypothetical protein DXA13_00055 [Clostridium sp. AM58-1XD]
MFRTLAGVSIWYRENDFSAALFFAFQERPCSEAAAGRPANAMLNIAISNRFCYTYIIMFENEKENRPEMHR